MFERGPEAILVAGASTPLGARVAAALMLETPAVLVLPLQDKTRDEVLERIAAEVASVGEVPASADPAGLVTLPLPAACHTDVEWLLPALREFEVGEIFYSAEPERSDDLSLTAAFLAMAARLRVRRFVFLSAAQEGWSRRARPGEAAVMSSGVNHLVLRVAPELGGSLQALRGPFLRAYYEVNEDAVIRLRPEESRPPNPFMAVMARA